MGRQKKFSREGVLEKVIPIFWQYGFAGTTLQHLERATGVNKSGLYAEFRDKGDLFLASLRHYVRQGADLEALTAQPLGWGNIGAYLRLAAGTPGHCRIAGCFAVNSMREFTLLPAGALDIIAQRRQAVRPLLADNIRVAGAAADPEILAEMVAVFFSGLCIEQNLHSGGGGATERKIDRFMQALRAL
ncbi:TetR/AcrR family transcriptional regulator [Acerihabitans arboris]|uniref:TetR family transcriptional regulator n=1 Tax=Acerihabitans arboris TaxID=2691583 RepID=A0A845SDA2_9GAMM|nr:TetR/AcrR family transcriptional regulator [Acerihabitans arboris]NDL62760.1 TetR family transcriptional regulator [Acerihabitans arboris]